jgi:hypothetical protein
VALMFVLVLVVALAVAFRKAWDRAGHGSVDIGERPDVAAMWRRREQERARRREEARQRRLPPLPPADAPPAGLTPLIPSPRTVRVEAARGISELEGWLADQTSA